MASSADLKENEMPVISNPAQLRCLDSAGNSGVIAPGTLLKYLNYIFSFKGIAGGNPTTWVGLGTFFISEYNPMRIDVLVRQYSTVETRKNISLSINSVGNIVYKDGSGYNYLGYVLRGNYIDIYIKLPVLFYYIGWVFGNYTSALSDKTTEPPGIVYVP